MNPNETLFRTLIGAGETESDIKQIWEKISNEPGFVDSKGCGLLDVVQSGWYQNDTNELFKGFHISDKDIVADIGCGDGGATLFCAKRGAHVHYSDIEAAKVEKLANKLKDQGITGCKGYKAEALKLPMSSELATRTVCMEVLEHVESPKEFLDELARITQPGGLILISTPDARSENIQRNIAPDIYFQKPNHIHIFDQDELEQLIQTANLELVSHDYFGFFWTLWMMFYWSIAKSAGANTDEVAHNSVEPPYPPLLNDWAKLWHAMINLPEAAPMKQVLDQTLPKSQVVIARKPN
ncbi:MAG: class I SAM-dependent methyltransferase, partial [Pseudomonadales bacterium]|nr:class I SAM-dependent methyltransferase [Pseudomonadales bacterium]